MNDLSKIRESVDKLVTVIAARVRLLEEQEIGADCNQRWKLATAWVLEQEAITALALATAQRQVLQELLKELRARVRQ